MKCTNKDTEHEVHPSRFPPTTASPQAANAWLYSSSQLLPNNLLPFFRAVVHLTEQVLRRYGGSIKRCPLSACTIVAGPHFRAYNRRETIGLERELKKNTITSTSVSGTLGSWTLLGGTDLSQLWMPRLFIAVVLLLYDSGGPIRPLE